MENENRLIQLFVYHVGERIDLVAAPSGSGKTRAVRIWLDSAQETVDQIWLVEHTEESLDQLPRSPDRPTFVVLDDYQPDPATDRKILQIVDETPHALHFVLTTNQQPSKVFLDRVDDGTVRLTTHADLQRSNGSDRLVAPIN